MPCKALTRKFYRSFLYTGRIMHRLFCVLLIPGMAACNNGKPVTTATQPADTGITKTAAGTPATNKNRPEDSFEQYSIQPVMQLSNTGGNQREISLDGHRITWMDTEKETKIKVDDDLFTLKDKKTLNIVWDHVDEVDFANNWDEIKLFKHKGNTYIGIRMSYTPCSGLACSVTYFLVYDVRTKTKNFFGTFRTGDALALYDFGNDDKVDYIAKTYTEQQVGGTVQVTHRSELYSIEAGGLFKLQADSHHQPYFMERTFEMGSSEKETTEKFTSNWITRRQ